MVATSTLQSVFFAYRDLCQMTQFLYSSHLALMQLSKQIFFSATATKRVRRMSCPDPSVPPAPAYGVYAISVAAELSGAAVQSIRLWEQRGLLTPQRTAGGTRRYSADDLARIARIMELVDGGVNIAGIRRILELEDDNQALRAGAARSTTATDGATADA
jgi:MerR family transcriptional regulator, heat shock protein HspR